MAEKMAHKILVVDDDETLANLLVNLLEMNDYEAEKSFSGKQALGMVDEEQPDLILLDIMMPELNGFDVLAKLRNNPATAEIPVVIVSVLSDDLYLLEGWVRDTDGYISKPFDPKHLIDTIKVVLSKTAEERLEERGRRIEQLLETIGKLEETYLKTAV